MNKHIRPFAIIGAFWFALFLFAVAGFSGSFGTTITGYAVSETGAPTEIGLQSIMILVLFFTNIATLFFLFREKANR